MNKPDLLRRPVVHVDPTDFDARPIIEAYRAMAFQARNLAGAADIVDRMLADADCGVILTLAGTLCSAATIFSVRCVSFCLRSSSRPAASSSSGPGSGWARMVAASTTVT